MACSFDQVTYAPGCAQAPHVRLRARHAVLRISPPQLRMAQVIVQAKWRVDQVSRRKWILERSRFAAEYSGVQGCGGRNTEPSIAAATILFP